MIGLPDREEAKTLVVAGSVYEALARFGLGRHDTIMGVGGGSVSDLAGFVAGTWLRGVEVVHVPTTLLAAVDAAMGETGVNLAGKNLVGLFWHPTRVIVDVNTLEDLPTTLRREGLAEALKTGLVGDRTSSSCSRRTVRTPPWRGRHQGSGGEGQGGRRRRAGLGSAGDPEFRAHHRPRRRVRLTPVPRRIGGDRHGCCWTDIGAEARFQSLDRMAPPSAGSVSPPGWMAWREPASKICSVTTRSDSSGMRMVLLGLFADPVVEHVEVADLDLGLDAVGL